MREQAQEVIGLLQSLTARQTEGLVDEYLESQKYLEEKLLLEMRNLERMVNHASLIAEELFIPHVNTRNSLRTNTLRLSAGSVTDREKHLLVRLNRDDIHESERYSVNMMGESCKKVSDMLSETAGIIREHEENEIKKLKSKGITLVDKSEISIQRIIDHMKKLERQLIRHNKSLLSLTVANKFWKKVFHGQTPKRDAFFKQHYETVETEVSRFIKDNTNESG